ncbi:MAG: hypothetical protein EXQ94_04125 [Alphaproteobacteria bacterium]|nr:hypothetical protein [Alphaproteobacteria bacterium]
MWDRLFGTHRAAPRSRFEHMIIGLDGLREPTDLGVHRLLVLPFALERGDAQLAAGLKRQASPYE